MEQIRVSSERIMWRTFWRLQLERLEKAKKEIEEALKIVQKGGRAPLFYFLQKRIKALEEVV